jgi:hypothetical protein
MSRLPSAEPARAMALAVAGEPAVDRGKGWGIIEID